MQNSETHFEVLGQRSGSWSLQKVCDGEKAAVDYARQFHSELKLDAAKVMKITYDTSAQNYIEKEVYFAGEKAVASKHSDVPPILPICKSASDLYLSNSRREIFNVLRKPLEGWKITPVELLYCAEHVQRLNDTGQILQGAVQKVAIAQIQKTGQKVNERVLELYNFTNEILQDLKTHRQKSDLGIDQNEDLEKLKQHLADNEDPRKDFFVALSHYFNRLPNLSDKFEKTLEFIEKYDDEEILDILDHYLADHLLWSANVKVLLGEEENLGEGLLALIDLIRGQLRPRADRHYIIDKLNSLYADNKMSISRKTLVHKLTTGLTGNASFDTTSLLQNILYHRKIAQALHLGGEKYIGESETYDALKNRCEKLTGSTTIGNLLEGLDHPLDRVERLLDASAGFVGAVNLRSLANYIVPILESAHNRGIVIEDIDKGFATLRRLSALQRKTRKTGFPDFFQRRILSDLDDLAYEGMMETKIMEKMVEQSENMLMAGMALLGTVFKGEMPRPKTMTEFKLFTRKTIMAEKFLMHIQQHAKGGAVEKSRLQQFYKLLEDTRMDLKS
ncbi:hypothetical protein GUA87_14055 [Sneathiella sp. P13V-1]|uniref:hypothetical protein n=1 Tax=Sneathiella sp. P13V-1 TaxID=2697366 RepID=UPI00187B73A0|nr:hypothetical protein [Sneathiella sp. P13V-1]MBE7637977.1 hypothetical protein [Sneathiella sp. P13V-1]